MKKYVVIIFLSAGMLFPLALAQSPLDDLRKRAEEALGNKRGPTDDRIAAGLKEALTVSTRKAVASTGRVDGFLKNAAIKILLPEKLRSVGKGMRLMGMGQQVDALEVGMNRAAEQAAPAARQIFIDAVTKMTIADARQILSGGDTAATQYFKTSSTEQLTAAFAPIVHRGHGKRWSNQAIQPADAEPCGGARGGKSGFQHRQICGRQNHGWAFLCDGGRRTQDSQGSRGANDCFAA